VKDVGGSVFFKLVYFRQALAKKQADLYVSQKNYLPQFSKVKNISTVSLGGKCPAESIFRIVLINHLGGSLLSFACVIFRSAHCFHFRAPNSNELEACGQSDLLVAPHDADITAR
jgi:hypothetical protein